MIVRRLTWTAIALLCGLGSAQAAPDATSSSVLPEAAKPRDARYDAYRKYAKAQADTLVGMTKVLAAEIRAGDLAAARDDYAVTHRYYERIVPLARTLPDVDKGIDGQAGDYIGKDADPDFSGFHRIEHGLFAEGSTNGLAPIADRLDRDSRILRERLVASELAPSVLLDRVVRMLRESADDSLTGDGERHSRTDLWDLEAKIDGARQVVALLQPQLDPRNETLVSATANFAAFDAALEKHKEGCGFKTYDQVTRGDRRTLEAPITALAAELATLQSTLAMN